MTLGRREYTEADMLRMQRDAEERVREMQNRARQTVEQDTLNIPPPRNRNWSSGQNPRRQNRRQQSPQPEAQQQQHERQQQHDRQQHDRQQHDRQQHDRQQNERQQQPEPPKEAAQPPAGTPEEKKKTTIIEDVMSALNLDEDYLLIIGLLLILINQRADTTLILALAYLLI